MTTNKPHVVAEVLQHLDNLIIDWKTPASDAQCQAGDQLILLSDYEAMERKCDNACLALKCQTENWERVVGQRDALQAECEKLRKDAETERAIQRAAEVLPPGFRIEIEIEKDYGGIALFSPSAIVECDFQGAIAEQINEAIDAAMQEEKP